MLVLLFRSDVEGLGVVLPEKERFLALLKSAGRRQLGAKALGGVPVHLGAIKAELTAVVGLGSQFEAALVFDRKVVLRALDFLGVAPAVNVLVRDLLVFAADLEDAVLLGGVEAGVLHGSLDGPGPQENGLPVGRPLSLGVLRHHAVLFLDLFDDL